MDSVKAMSSVLLVRMEVKWGTLSVAPRVQCACVFFSPRKTINTPFFPTKNASIVNSVVEISLPHYQYHNEEMLWGKRVFSFLPLNEFTQDLPLLFCQE